MQKYRACQLHNIKFLYEKKFPNRHTVCNFSFDFFSPATYLSQQTLSTTFIAVTEDNGNNQWKNKHARLAYSLIFNYRV